MSENNMKPNVFPKTQTTQETDREATHEDKLNVTNIVLTTSLPIDTPATHIDAVEIMRRRTEDQLRQLNENGTVVDLSLSEKTGRIATKYEQDVEAIRKKSEEQMKIRDEHLNKNIQQTQHYQKQYEQMSTQPIQPTLQPTQPTQINKPMEPQNFGENPKNIQPHIVELSQPNYNSPFDVIPLPSKGKLYRDKKESIKVSYLTTADENILTSPNLLQSGQFLEILINRKVLEPNLRYRDLHIGDRNAIMIWLRATGYGEEYPVTLLDEKNVPFDTEINLRELNIKNLGAEPDQEGLFTFTFPLSKKTIKFKLLTCGDVDDIELAVAAEQEAGYLVDNTSTYMIEKSIIEVDGTRDRNHIKDFSNNIRVMDGEKFMNYITEIESGVDLNLVVGTPGGGSVATFLPLNIKFFWPKLNL